MEDCPRRPGNKQSLIDLELHVSSLISPDGHWRLDMLNELFPLDDVSRILAMQLYRVSDRYSWAYNNHGAYSVKSGY